MASRSTGADLSCDSYKIALIGDHGVGKTSILLRLVDGIFKDDGQLKEGMECKNYSLTVDDKMAKLSIWDRSERDRFMDSDCNPPIYRGAAGIMIVYDSTNEESFSDVSNWIEDVDRFGQADENVIKMLIENKCDLKNNREVHQGAGKELAAKHQVLFKQTSALDGTNIEAAFEDLVRAIRRKRCPDTITITKEPTKNKSSCY